MACLTEKPGRFVSKNYEIDCSIKVVQWWLCCSLRLLVTMWLNCVLMQFRWCYMLFYFLHISLILSVTMSLIINHLTSSILNIRQYDQSPLYKHITIMVDFFTFTCKRDVSFNRFPCISHVLL
jgi:hypothetical protein